jgi:hypothetical protein
MARDINRPMLWQQAVDTFTNTIVPQFSRRHDGTLDTIALSEAWNNWTDSLCKSRVISDWQYENWSHPPCNE